MAERSARVAIVTGSDSGIGRATAVAPAGQGCDVGITWHEDADGAEATAAEVRALGRRAEVRRLDLTALPGAADAVDELAEALGGVDVLVDNAGTGHSSPVLELGWDTWREVLATDLDGAFPCLQRAARRMVAAGHGGRIAAVELAEHGITVNAVAPGEIATPMTGQQDEDPTAPGRERPGVPLRRPGDAREVAAVIAFLASPEAGYVTWASWPVDGGMLQMGPMAGSHLRSDDWRRA